MIHRKAFSALILAAITLTSGCAGFTMAPEPMISNVHANVLTRSMVFSDRLIVKITHVDSSGIFDYLRVNHIDPGFQSVRTRCTLKYADDMAWIIQEKEYFLGPGYCYVPKPTTNWTSPECGVEIVKTDCSNFESMATKAQPSALPVGYREEMPASR